MFSDDDGTASVSRLCTFLLVLAAIGWVSYLVKVNHQIPDLLGLAALLGALYGINHVPAMIQSYRSPDLQKDSFASNLSKPGV